MTRAKMNMKSKSAVSTQKGKALKVSLRNMQIFRNLALNNKIKVGETMFLALSQQLRHHGVTTSHKRISQELVEYLRKHSTPNPTVGHLYSGTSL